MPLKEFISAILIFAYILSALFITATISRLAGIALLLPVFGAALFLAFREYRDENFDFEGGTEHATKENTINKRLHFLVRVIWVVILFAVVIGAMLYL
ncbi:hypothetical protein [Thalassolituus sp. C2-1]|uniref:hypothetical protein n=1 Tax=Venatorbacter sp. C2-1 TaxID=2597518 RepID=UPI00119758BA|nr:hypothetical protein [Thalassolituus sp. C2-1]TVV43198.1 hypothetical protein FOT50_12215 [Thalassolituus sp. C2-1]